MSRSTRIFGAFAVGAAVTGGSAFTSSNSFTQPTQVVGYAEQTSTGALIVGVTYTPLPEDRSRLAAVTFVSTTDLDGKSASLTLKDGADLVASYPCAAPTPYASGLTTIVCTVTGHDLIEAFDKTGITVS